MTSEILQKLPWMAGGLGLAEAENHFLADQLPEPVKRINDGLGVTTGILASNPAYRMHALSSLPFKQLALLGVGGLEKFRQAQEGLVRTNLQTARTNLRTAISNSGNANYLKLLALGSLLGGGGLAYYAYNKAKPKPNNRFQVVSDRGNQSRGGHKIRIEIPPGALPHDFFPSLVNIDDNPRARVQTMEKVSGVLPTLGNMLGEWSGVLPGVRAPEDAYNALQNYQNDDYSNAGRYGLSALGNGAFAAVGANTFAFPAAAKLLTRERLNAWRRSGNPITSPIGKYLYNTQFRNQMDPNRLVGGVRFDQAARRGELASQFGSQMLRGTVDRARDMRFATRPNVLRWIPPEIPPTSVLGHLGNTGRYLGNRALRGGYESLQFLRRSPNLALTLLGLPLAGLGVLADSQKTEVPHVAMPQTTGIRGMPISSILSNIMPMLGGENPNHSVMDQLRGAP